MLTSGSISLTRTQSHQYKERGNVMFLEIKGIKKHFGEGDSRIEVLKGIDMEIEKEELCVLLGPSGSGKSTLLKLLMRF